MICIYIYIYIYIYEVHSINSKPSWYFSTCNPVCCRCKAFWLNHRNPFSGAGTGNISSSTLYTTAFIPIYSAKCFHKYKHIYNSGNNNVTLAIMLIVFDSSYSRNLNTFRLRFTELNSKKTWKEMDLAEANGLNASFWVLLWQSFVEIC